MRQGVTSIVRQIRFAERTGWLFSYFSYRVYSTPRACWNAAVWTTAQEGFDFCPSDDAVGFSVFHGPLIFCRVDLAKIVDTGINRRMGPHSYEIGNGNQTKQTNGSNNRQPDD